METYKNNWFKFIAGFIFCLLLRLIPFRPPNIEPLLATQMPFSKKFGAWAGFIFGFCSIILYDSLSGHLGIWSLLVGVAYGLLGILSVLFFKKREMTRINFVKFAVLGTLFFDIITGLTIGPIFFHQNFFVALSGQIPFTLYHLAGNIAFALIISPVMHRYITENRKLNYNFSGSIINILNHKKAYE